MPNTTRWYEIGGNFSPHLTRICFLDNFRSLRSLVVNCRRNKYSYNEIEHFRQFRTLSLYLLLMKIARHLKIANRKTEFGVVSIRI
jgi:hypothetical protein